MGEHSNVTDLIDASGEALIFRRPDGSVLLNTNDRMPAVDGSASFSGTFTFPRSGSVQGRIVSGGGFEFRYKYSSGKDTYQEVLGAAPSGYVPNFILARLKLTRSASTNIFGFVNVLQQVPQGAWRQLDGGNVWIEMMRTSSAGDNPIFQRYAWIDIDAGNWVLNFEESSRSYTSNWTNTIPGSGDAETDYDYELEMSWGTFDL